MCKERLWQVYLIAILGLTLTMCSRSSSNNSTSSTGILNADGTSTVSASSLPTITLDNSSTFAVSLVNAGPSAISHTMFCTGYSMSSGVITYSNCDASDDTVLSSYGITHDASLAAGWKLVGPSCSAAGGGGNSKYCLLFHK